MSKCYDLSRLWTTLQTQRENEVRGPLDAAIALWNCSSCLAEGKPYCQLGVLAAQKAWDFWGTTCLITLMLQMHFEQLADWYPHRFQAVDHCTNHGGVWSAEKLAQSEGGRLAADSIVWAHRRERRQNAIKKVSSGRTKASFRRNVDREMVGL